MNENRSDGDYVACYGGSTNSYDGMGDSIPIRKSNPKSRADILKRFLTKAESSYIYNIIKVFIPVSKFTTTILVLSLSSAGCYRPLEVWFVFMLLNDFFAIVLRSLVLYNLIQMNRTKRSSTIPDLLNYEAVEKKALKYEDILYGSSSLVLMSSERFKRRERMKQALMVIWWVKVIFYIALILWGQAVFVKMPLECRRTESGRATLTLIYLIVGYLYISMPIVFLFIGCFVMGRSSWGLGDFIKKMCKKRQMTESQLGKLVVEKYASNSGLPGYHECIICTKTYEEGENIVTLKCDPSHHFHEKCVKKELKKQKSCPICEKGISRNSVNSEAFKSITSVAQSEN